MTPEREFASGETPHFGPGRADIEKSTSEANTTGVSGAKTKNAIIRIATYVPPQCRFDHSSGEAFGFTLAYNLLFAFATTITVANLYYVQPLLDVLAHSFDVSQERVGILPTLLQAGYAAGLFLIAPFGDLFRRRAFILILIILTAGLSLGLALAPSFSAFAALSFLNGFFTVTPQIILPLVADLAPPEKRGLAISYTTSGLLLGMLVARIIAGLIAEFSSWRIVYYTAFGLQALILVLLYLFLPDIPPTDEEETFGGILRTMLILLKTHPLLVQCSLIGALTSSAFTSYWTTLAFLLSAPPFNYSTLIIGLFAFLGAGAILASPIAGKHIIDRFIPHLSSLMGLLVILVAQVLGTALGPISVAGPVLQALFLDVGQQITMNANRVAIYGLDGKKRARLNSVYMIFAFLGQTMGTGVGSKLYSRGGWRASSGAATGFVGLALIIWAFRGPWSNRWAGWDGGWSLRKRIQEREITETKQPHLEEPQLDHTPRLSVERH